MSTANAMQLVTPHVGFVSALEVRDLLVSLQGEQQAQLDEARMTHTMGVAKSREVVLPAFDEAAERNRILSDQQRIMLAKTVQYLEDPTLRRGTLASSDQIRAYLKEVDDYVGPETFTKVEKLRLANQPPSSVPELFCLIELVGDRICEAKGLERTEENIVMVSERVIEITDDLFAGRDAGESQPQAELGSFAPQYEQNGDLQEEEQQQIDEAAAEDAAETDLVQEARAAPRDDLEIDEMQES